MSLSFRFSPLFSLSLLLFCLLLPPSTCSVTVLTNNATYPDRVAAFGPRINSTGITGTLISMFSFNVSNVLACDDMEFNPNVTHWIALVERGDCTFLEKVRSMQKAGAIAVIVGDNKPASSLVTMYATEDSSDIDIPSVFVTKSTYDSLIVQAAPLNGEYFLPVLIDNSQIIEWPMLDIVIVTIIAPSVIMIFLYSIWRFRRRSQQKREVAPPSVVISLPVRIYTKPEDPQDEEETCPICLEDFKEGDELRILPCKHEYHVNCVDQWLTTRKRFCPLCKVDACPDAATEESRLIIRNLFSSRTTAPVDNSSEPTGMHLQEESQRNVRVDQELSSNPAPEGVPASTSSAAPSSSSGNPKGYRQLEDD